MASVAKYGKGYCVRYRVTDAQGVVTAKRVSGFPTKEAAWEQARKLERQSNAGIDVHGGEMTCGQLMERWFVEHCIGSTADTTLAKYSAGIDRLKTFPIYTLPIKRVSAQTQNELISALRAGESTGREIAVRTATSLIEPLRLSMSWAAKHGIIPVNPLAVAKLPKTPKRKQRILNDQDVDALMSFTVGHPFRVPLLLALYGGLRREEAAALRWENVDFKRRTITITEATTRTATGKTIHKDTKNETSRRTISMPRFVINELQAVTKPSGRVCVSSDARPYVLSSYPQAVKRIIRAINGQRAGTEIPPMPEATYHDLRHTHAAMLIKIGMQPKVIQERLGHASIKITMDLYGYLMSGLQEAVADALDEQFQTNKNRHKNRHTRKYTLVKSSVSLSANETKKQTEVV